MFCRLTWQEVMVYALGGRASDVLVLVGVAAQPVSAAKEGAGVASFSPVAPVCVVQLLLLLLTLHVFHRR